MINSEVHEEDMRWGRKRVRSESSDVSGLEERGTAYWKEEFCWREEREQKPALQAW